MERLKSLPINFVLITFGIVLTCLYIISSPSFLKGNSFFTFAVTFDLTITINLAYYFFVVRKYKIHVLTIIPMYVITLAIASFVIPAEKQSYLGYFKELMVIPELVLISFLFIKTKVVIKEFKSIKFITQDFIEQLYRGINKALNNKLLSGIFTTELSVLHYSFTFWKRKKEVFDGQINVSYHKKTSYSALWFVIMSMVIVEAFSLHIFIRQYSSAAAWVLTAISIYTIFFFTADFSAMIRRPIVITIDLLCLRCGMRWRVVIPYEKILSMQSVKNFKDDSKEFLNISVTKQPNVTINLKEPVDVKGLYGITKKSDKIAFNIDDFKTLENWFNSLT